MKQYNSWKVIAVDKHNILVAEYLFAIEEEALAFYADMLNKDYETVCFKVEV